MSCHQCCLHKGKFNTEAEFLRFEELISNLVKSDRLVELGLKPGSKFYEMRYRCNICSSVWTLSFPDQAFRGGWHEQ